MRGLFITLIALVVVGALAYFGLKGPYNNMVDMDEIPHTHDYDHVNGKEKASIQRYGLNGYKTTNGYGLYTNGRPDYNVADANRLINSQGRIHDHDVYKHYLRIQ